MQAILPLDVYVALEKSLGKDEATRVVKSLETAITDMTEYKWQTSRQLLMEDMRKEFATKADLSQLKVDLMKWITGILIAQTGVMVAIMRLLR